LWARAALMQNKFEHQTYFNRPCHQTAENLSVTLIKGTAEDYHGLSI
jgi:hypothetical protein